MPCSLKNADIFFNKFVDIIDLIRSIDHGQKYENRENLSNPWMAANFDLKQLKLFVLG